MPVGKNFFIDHVDAEKNNDEWIKDSEVDTGLGNGSGHQCIGYPYQWEHQKPGRKHPLRFKKSFFFKEPGNEEYFHQHKNIAVHMRLMPF